MVLVNYATREITAKVVYYGPGLCGKTTNLQFIYDSLPSTNKSKMLSLATQQDRTLFFDFLPLDLGRIRGMKTRLQLYTVPGQVYYNSTRQLVLKGADGVVFVADSQDSAMDGNIESLRNLEENLRKQGIRIAEIPLVLQYNKRDLPNRLPVAELETRLNHLKVRSFESVATTGVGVEQTLNGIAQQVLAHLARKYGLDGGDEEPPLQVLNPPAAQPVPPAESVWLEEEAVPETPAAPIPPSPPAPARPSEYSAPSFLETVSEPDPVPFSELIERFEAPVEVSMESFSRPAVGKAAAAGGLQVQPLIDVVPEPFSAAAPGTSVAPPPDPEPASQEPLVKEISLPLNLTADELRRYRKLKLRLTIDVNILP